MSVKDFLDFTGLTIFYNQLNSRFATKDDINNAQSDWNTIDETASSYIKNKPDSLPASDVSAWAKADSKPSYTKTEVGLGNVPNVATNNQTPTYTEASTIAKLTSGEKLSVSFGKIAKAISDLISHINDNVKHITSTERTNWDAAKTHADSTHAPTNAEANQNAFSNIVVGATTIAADSKTDTLTLAAGSNVTLTPDANNDKITISSKNTVYTHPTTSGNKHIPSGGSSGQILRWSADGTAVWGADNNNTYGEVSSSSNGLMTPELFNKLNNLDTNQLGIFNFNNTDLSSNWSSAYYYKYEDDAVLGNLSSSSSTISIPAHTTRYIRINLTSDISKTSFPVISWYGEYTILGLDVYSNWVSSSKAIYIYVTNNGASAQEFQLNSVNFILASGYTNITGTHNFEVKDDGHLYVTY